MDVGIVRKDLKTEVGVGRTRRPESRRPESHVPAIRIDFVTREQLHTMAKMSTMKIVCAKDSSAALTDTGKLYMWGKSAQGKLGLGRAVHGSVPSTLFFFITLEPRVE